MARHQRGCIYEAFGVFHVRYYVTEIVEGKPVKKQRSHRLGTQDCATGLGPRSAMAVRSLCEEDSAGGVPVVEPLRSLLEKLRSQSTG